MKSLVHLDLKGAPPKLSYYEQIFPLFEKWGATGLLIEYEDTFPYSSDLVDIAAPNAYSTTEVQQLQILAAKHNLEVIPLVQTFGHFEFVLKHEKFRHLREIPANPMSLCPLKQGSLDVIQKMVEQVVQIHPNIQYFHIGADEVYHVGVCKDCHSFMVNGKLSKEQMFFMHVKKVLTMIKSLFPNLTLIMWDDMFRRTEVQVMKDSNISSLVEPMVWYYQHSFAYLPEGIWERYSQVFDSIWIASAFKGATGPCMFVTDISMHLENHRNWINVVNGIVQKLFKNYRGCAITGWQRYDHYAVLCELLPVGIPSLAMCLLTLTGGSFTEAVHKQASEDLGFKELIPLSPSLSIGVIPECSFPGSNVYKGALAVLLLKEEYKQFITNDRMLGWMSPYHVRHNYTNPEHLQYFLPQAQALLASLENISSQMKTALSEIFHTDTVDEWLAVLVQPKIDHISEIVDTTVQQIEFGAHPKQVPEMDQT